MSGSVEITTWDWCLSKHSLAKMQIFSLFVSTLNFFQGQQFSLSILEILYHNFSFQSGISPKSRSVLPDMLACCSWVKCLLYWAQLCHFVHYKRHLSHLFLTVLYISTKKWWFGCGFGISSSSNFLTKSMGCTLSAALCWLHQNIFLKTDKKLCIFHSKEEKYSLITLEIF